MEVQPGHDVPGVFHQLVQVRHLQMVIRKLINPKTECKYTLLKLIQEVQLQVSQLVTGGHVQLVVRLGGEEAGPELTQHCASTHP